MTETKYEIRSEEMTSLLKKIPHSLITRGNVLVPIILIVFFYLLNRFAPADQLKLAAHVDRIIIHDKNKDLMDFSLIVKNMKDSLDSFQSNFEYRFEDGHSTKRHTVSGKIDTIIYKNIHLTVFYVKSNYSFSLKEKSSGILVIDKEEKSLFSRIISGVLSL